jgi:endonuclease YncB( thermonuclease family)
MAVWKTLLMLKFSKTIKIFAIFFIATKAIFLPAMAKNKASNNVSNTWQGIVIHVTDGDTLRVRPLGSNNKSDSVRIRIDGIDAPESCQTYGVKSAAALKKLLISKQVTVISKRFDDYGRDVAKVMIENVDVGGLLVKNGHAWSYHYRFSAGPYGQEEAAASRAKLGLFANASAVEPKIFRREHGSCYVPTKNDRKRYK